MSSATSFPAGGKALAAGLLGDDRSGRKIVRMVEDLGADSQGLIF